MGVELTADADTAPLRTTVAAAAIVTTRWKFIPEVYPHAKRTETSLFEGIPLRAGTS